jgi:hypothetical protein
MTQHPITPPPELLQLWGDQHYGCNKGFNELLIEAAQWGSDQELEACCEWLSVPCPSYGRELRNARRPKPPGLKEQALLSIDTAVADYRMSADVANIVRRALEQLPDHTRDGDFNG